MGEFITKNAQLIAAILSIIAAVIAAIWGRSHLEKKKAQRQRNTINTQINVTQSHSDFSRTNFGVQNTEVNVGDEHNEMD